MLSIASLGTANGMPECLGVGVRFEITLQCTTSTGKGKT